MGKPAPDFETAFRAWLKTALLSEEIPEEVEAFALRIFQTDTQENRFGIELYGAGEFSADHDDWVFDEIWEPAARRLPIDDAFAGGNWEKCLAKTRTLLGETIESESEIARVLTSRQGMGIGYEDREFEVLEFE